MKVISIKTIFEDYVLPENIYIFIRLWYYVVNNDAAPSTSSQTVEQIEETKEVVLSAVSKLND